MDFKLPDIGEGIHEGEIVKWLVKEGDIVKEDQPLVEVMTDKATVEIPSPAKGKIQKIYCKEGQIVKVESVIVTIAEEGVAQSHPERSSGSLATPAIRKLAKDLGIDLSTVKGTGPGGKIIEQDLKSSHPSPSSHTSSSSHPERSEGSQERIPLRGIRKTIAQHLQKAKQLAPHYTYVDEVDMTDLVKLRDEKDKISYIAFIAKALIPALKEFPYLNASLDEVTQEIILKKYYHVGVAVATEDGLVVPVVKDTDKKTIDDVAKEIVRLSEDVRQHKAKPEELKGGTFTITSIGSIGGVFSTPIINTPEVAILGVNKIVERPVIREGKVVPRHMMYLSLTLDHRVVDGAIAAHFMNKLISILQNPRTIS